MSLNKFIVVTLLIIILNGCGKTHKPPITNLPIISKEDNNKYLKSDELQKSKSLWPGTNTITSVDDITIKLGENTSGLTYQPKSVDGNGYLWAVKNNPSILYKLIFNSQTKLWNKNKEWNLESFSKTPYDSEGVTKAEWDKPFVYIATEKEKSGNSKLSIIMYDTENSKLVMDWNLSYHPSNNNTVKKEVNQNKGWEGLTWIPDKDLVASDFYDFGKNKIYNPEDYPNHGSGLFVAGLEENGDLYVYALNHQDNSFNLIAHWNKGFTKIMGLEYDRSTGYLWIHCDNNCDNSSKILEIDSNPLSDNYGQFKISAEFSRPSNIKNSNYEGIALFPDDECKNNKKNIIWADDDGTFGDTLINDYIPCGSFLK